MTRAEAKTIFLNRGYIEVDGGSYFDGNKWRESIAVISEWLKEEPCEVITRIPKDYLYDTETEDVLVYRHKYTGKEIHIEKPVKRYRIEPCEDAISRQAVLELIADYDLSMGQVVKGVHDLPPVTPQPKTEHWVKTIGENGITSAVRCSECGFEDNRYMLFRYCPNCGAKMAESEDKE